MFENLNKNVQNHLTDPGEQLMKQLRADTELSYESMMAGYHQQTSKLIWLFPSVRGVPS